VPFTTVTYLIVVCLSVSQSVTIVRPAKPAERIEMYFRTWTRVDPRNHVLNRGAQRRHTANTIEPSMCGGDAALCLITVTTCCERILSECCAV